ncbi:unnamed protein product [Caenorhabditis angaria]|uniref:Uncharacterized protein n=1 Tax=Caenorhabditis angaria TaxID=860376 RepID=A0A9P1N789_9PELO|nr:unnamed protein product [Caenorhabditis angaria]
MGCSKFWVLAGGFTAIWASYKMGQFSEHHRQFHSSHYHFENHPGCSWSQKYWCSKIAKHREAAPNDTPQLQQKSESELLETK